MRCKSHVKTVRATRATAQCRSPVSVSLGHQCGEHSLPGAVDSPHAQPVVDASPFAVLLRQVGPLRSGLVLPGDRMDHLSMVPPPATPAWASGPGVMARSAPKCGSVKVHPDRRPAGPGQTAWVRQPVHRAARGRGQQLLGGLARCLRARRSGVRRRHRAAVTADGCACRRTSALMTGWRRGRRARRAERRGGPESRCNSALCRRHHERREGAAIPDDLT